MHIVTNPSYVIRCVTPNVPQKRIYDLDIYTGHFRTLRKTLNEAKKKLDKYEKDKFYHSFVRNLYPYGKFKYIIQKRMKIPYITNAWLKTYQLLYTIKDMLPYVGEYRAFFNANAPGASSHAADFFFSKHTKLNFRWVASTYIGGDGTLNDEYGLIAKHRDKWMMDENNNGDVRCAKNIKKFIEKIGTKLVDLYFSDVAIDVKGNYEQEEFLEMNEVFGQNVCGLLCLAPGGIMIVKQRSFLLPFNVWMIGEMSKLFRYFTIHKPSTSRSYNSEVYLVGVGFLGMSESKAAFMLKVLENFSHYRSIVPSPMNAHIIRQIAMCALEFVNLQVEALISCVVYYEKYKYKLPELYQKLSQSQATLREKFLEEYRLYS